VYSLFAGRAATVDDWLIQRGLLRRIERAEDLPVITRRQNRESTLDELAGRARAILQTFVDVTLARPAGAGQAGVAE
jgi:hypothetical protein